MPGIFENLNCSPNPQLCFVMMPFAKEFDAIYRLIQRCCKEQGLDCVRADEDAKPGQITGKIYEMLSGAGIVIADMTGKNPNVFYELGLAHAISDNVILLTQSTEDVPFDLKDFLHIRYANSFDGAERLAADLSKAINTVSSSADFRIPLNDERRAKEPEEIQDVLPSDQDFNLLHLKAEIAREDGEVNQARRWLEIAFDAASKGGGQAGEVGNCAIEAERCGFLDLAESLYKYAIERDPMHVNNRQCYLSFILDHRGRDQDQIELASGLLEGLEKEPERQERTRALRAQLLTLKQQDSADGLDFDALLDDVLGDGEFTSIGEAAPVLLLLQKHGRYDKMREIVEALRKKTPDEMCYKLDRVLADAWADSSDNDLQLEAITLYRDLLKSECDTTPALKHNLATLLFSREGDYQEIRSLWTDAYSERPNDNKVRNAFGQFLMRNGQKEDAIKVLEGNPLEG